MQVAVAAGAKLARKAAAVQSRLVQVDRLRGSLPRPRDLRQASHFRARVGRQEHGSSTRSNADRFAIRIATAKGAREASGDDGASAPRQGDRRSQEQEPGERFGRGVPVAALDIADERSRAENAAAEIE